MLSKIQKKISPRFITGLTWVAFICILINIICVCTDELINFSPDLNSGFKFIITQHLFGGLGQLLRVRTPLLITILPFILMVIYLNTSHKKFKGALSIPIIFLLITVIKFFEFNLEYETIKSYRQYNVITMGIDNILVIALYVLAIFSSLKGLKEKKFPTIAIIFDIVTFLYDTIRRLKWWVPSIIKDVSENLSETEFFRLQIGDIIGSVGYEIIQPLGYILLLAALVMFCIKFKIPSVLPQKSKNEYIDLKTMHPLEVLNKKLEFNMITEEEYQAQRTEIINNL